jgi:hypothetical protein
MRHISKRFLQLLSQYKRFTAQTVGEIRGFAINLIYVLQASQQANYWSCDQYVRSDND